MRHSPCDEEIQGVDSWLVDLLGHPNSAVNNLGVVCNFGSMTAVGSLKKNLLFFVPISLPSAYDHSFSP